MAIQKGNAVAMMGSLPRGRHLCELIVKIIAFVCLFLVFRFLCRRLIFIYFLGYSLVLSCL